MSIIINQQNSSSPQDFFSLGFSKIEEGMGVFAKVEVESLPEIYFSNSSLPDPQIAKVLYGFARKMLVDRKKANWNSSKTASNYIVTHVCPNPPTDYILDIRKFVEKSGAQTYHEEFQKKFLERYLKYLSPKQLEIFYQRVAKVWSQTTFSKKNVNAELGREHLEKEPASYIVTQALNEDRLSFHMHLLHHYLNLKTDAISVDQQIETVKGMYIDLPKKCRFAIEGLVWKNRLEETQDPEFGKHYVERLFRDKNNVDLTPIIKALEQYLKEGPLSLSPNLSHSCDESIKPPFFKIKDEQGKTRGYLLGTCHFLPKEHCKFPRKIRHSLFKSRMVAPESPIGKKTLIAYLPPYRDRFSLNCHPIRGVEAKLEIMAHNLRKAVVPLDDPRQSGLVLKALGISDLEKRIALSFTDPQVGESEFQALFKQGERWKQGDCETGKLETIRDICLEAGHPKEEIENLIAVKNIEKLNQIFLDLPPTFKEKFDRIFTDRDIIMSNNLDLFLKYDPNFRVFAAIGSAHLPQIGDSKGVITLLREKGWAVVPA